MSRNRGGDDHVEVDFNDSTNPFDYIQFSDTDKIIEQALSSRSMGRKDGEEA
jgi:hypothetical protein